MSDSFDLWGASLCWGYEAAALPSTKRVFGGLRCRIEGFGLGVARNFRFRTAQLFLVLAKQKIICLEPSVDLRLGRKSQRRRKNLGPASF